MKKFLLLVMVSGFMFSGTVFKVGAITATNEGYSIQIDYSSDTVVGGYQFNLLSDGALSLGSCPSTPDDYGFTVSCGQATGMVLAFSFTGTSVPANMSSDPLATEAGSRTYGTLVTLPITVNAGFESASIVVEANEASDGSSRLVVSNATGSAVDADFHEAVFEDNKSNKPEGEVIKVIQSGYTIDERLLRPASVAISKGKQVKKN